MKICKHSMRVALVLPCVVVAFIGTNARSASSSSTTTLSLTNPILFVTQVPTVGGDRFASRTSTFANHLPQIASVPRGGDLMIRYPNGTLRNLTQEAGFGETGRQGANAIAVRDPSVHWSGSKALFSMVIGAPPRQYDISSNGKWQIYEVSGLGQSDTVSIRKLPSQPDYNNVTPIYDTKDRILFTSDRPRDGSAHLYPQLDEYESTPIVTGLWQLDPRDQSLRMLNHTPSGLFSPSIDSFGRVIFTRWDHLQRDQQADGSPGNGFTIQTFASEAANASTIANQEIFPESRLGQTSAAYGPVNGFTFNLFQPWEMNEDGTAELTLNHAGRHELSFGYIQKSFANDAALSDFTPTTFADNTSIANKRNIRIDNGIFQIKEDPVAPGTYFGIYAPEFGSMNSGTLLKFNGAPSVNAEQMAFVDVASPVVSGSLTGGRIRDPLPLSNGAFVAVHSGSNTVNANIDFRLKEFSTATNGTKSPGAALTGAGISKSVSWWSPDVLQSYNGVLWELEPVEVVARTRPAARTASVASIEQQVLAEESVNEAALSTWLKANDLALIVTRNQTSRDRADLQQPQNLRVPGGVQTTANGGRVYDIAHYQIFQADHVRGYGANKEGRRPIARTMPRGKNLANANGPAGSVKIAADGSSAAFVPANRALTWQTTDASGEPVVRERVWITMQPGEIRTCAGCHGENAKNQAGVSGDPTNKPQALRDLLAHWKTISGAATPLAFDIDGSGACTPTDALLMMRYLKGVRGMALTAGVSFPASATRKSHDAIVAQLDSVASLTDIDGDSRSLSTTDGLMFSRYTQLLTGGNLTAAARNPMIGGGTKTDQDIKNYIDTRCVASS
jgi:Hydrazine synthase alpha subunit middle domain